MNQLRFAILTSVVLCGLWSASASAQTRIVVTTQPAVATTPYYLPFGFSYTMPGYSPYLNYGPYTGQGFSSIQPGSAGYNGQPLIPAPIYVNPDPYYPYYPPVYGPAYTPARGVNRSNWGLDNVRPVGSPYRR